MNSSPILLYTFLSSEYYENINQYESGEEFRLIVQQALPDLWHCQPRGFWTNVTPPSWQGVPYGWKIHLSSTVGNAKETLNVAVQVLSKSSVAFKFCSDERMLSMSLGKVWPRSQAGKFITIYPRSESECRLLLESLHRLTAHLVGPHILTDRAYSGSRVVHYRYGAHAAFTRVDPFGSHTAGYNSDDGIWHEDIRAPHFSLPVGVVDPFSPPSSPKPGPAEVLLANRYLVKGALKYNASGGIYFGYDRETGREVIIREARGTLGHLESDMPEDPAFILRREARILQALESTGLVPQFVDLFKEWNNWFLVVERLDAISLWGHSMEFYFSTEAQTSSFGLGKITATIEAIAQGLILVHERGIILRDLTRNNVMFTRASGDIKFIDLEFAYEVSSTEPWLKGWTPGYASASQAAMARPTVDDDIYAFGVLILDMLTFSAAGLELDRKGIFSKLRLVLGDLGLPAVLYKIVEGLTADVPLRWSLLDVIVALRGLSSGPMDQPMLPVRERLLEMPGQPKHFIENLGRIEAMMLSELDAAAQFSRKDRLWPASPEVFITNPLSMQYGAVGPALFQLVSRGHVHGTVLDWIEDRAAEHDLPPGLYSGSSGVALLLAKAGRVESALRMVKKVEADSFDHHGLYFGLAGWGIFNLHMWHLTGHEQYLLKSVEAADYLISRRKIHPDGINWEYRGNTYFGLGDGQAGVALFFVYLAAATTDPRYAFLAEQALSFDVAHAQRVAGRVVWTTHLSSAELSTKLPHTRFGSAGIGSVCLRYFALSGDNRFREVALDCAHTVQARISNKIWQDEGCAGYGEFFLDLAQFLKEPRFVNLAYYHAEAILCHAIDRPAGKAFAGIDHYRICWDYAAGGSGIGIFLQRLRTHGPRMLMLDCLLSSTPSPVICLGDKELAFELSSVA